MSYITETGKTEVIATIKRHIVSPLTTIKISNKLLDRPNSPVVKSDVKKKQQGTHQTSAVTGASVCVTSRCYSAKSPLESNVLRQVSLVYSSLEFLTLTRFIFSTIRACIHGGGGLHVGEVTRFVGVTCLSI